MVIAAILTAMNTADAIGAVAIDHSLHCLHHPNTLPSSSAAIIYIAAAARATIAHAVTTLLSAAC